jgi:hypothetical protein
MKRSTGEHKTKGEVSTMPKKKEKKEAKKAPPPKKSFGSATEFAAHAKTQIGPSGGKRKAR